MLVTTAREMNVKVFDKRPRLSLVKTLGRIERLVEAEPVRELRLKGFSRAVKGFNLLKMREEKQAISEN